MQPNARGHYLVMPMGVELGLRLENGVSWLHWWDDAGNLLLTGAEKAVQAEQKQVQAEAIAEQQKAIAAQERLAKEQPEAIANQERDQKEKLANYSRSMGINPDQI